MLPAAVVILLILGVVLIMYLREEQRRSLADSPRARIEQVWRGAERRRTVRLSTTLSARYRVLQPDSRFAETKSANLSAGGIQLLLEEKLSPRMLIALEIILSDHQAKVLTMTGRVMWVSEVPMDESQEGKRQFRTGIQFVNLTPADEQRLFEFIEQGVGQGASIISG